MKNLFHLKKAHHFSTPNRLVILFEGLQKQITLKSEEIKGPNVESSRSSIGRIYQIK